MQFIELSQGCITVVDDDWYECLMYLNWYVARSNTEKDNAYHNPYAISYVKGKRVRMHRLIMDCPQNMVVDHIDGNSLNNQRSNLRVCSQKENSRNVKKRRGHPSGKGKFKGAYYHQKKWKSQLKSDGKMYYLGVYDSEKEAAMAYDEKAKELFGAFASLNFPSEGHTKN